MLGKSQIKFIRGLRLTKFRRQEKLFVVEGDKMVKEALDPHTNPEFRVRSLYGTGEWLEENITGHLGKDVQVH